MDSKPKSWRSYAVIALTAVAGPIIIQGLHLHGWTMVVGVMTWMSLVAVAGRATQRRG